MALFKKKTEQVDAEEAKEINETDDLENLVSESEDDNKSNVISKINPLDKVKQNKKAMNFIDFVKINKKSLIQTGCLLLGVVILSAAANEIVFKTKDTKGNSASYFNSQYDALVKEYNDTKNEMDIFEKTDPYYTKVDVSTSDNKNKNVNWIGDKIDEGRWKTDDAYFWTWIEPAFSFKSAVEYNNNVREFITTKGVPEDHLFVTTFLQYYDYQSDLRFDVNNDGKLSGDEATQANNKYKSSTQKSRYYTLPIGITENGDYHYLAMVPQYVGLRDIDYRAIAFTFTIKHNINPVTNSDTMEVTDFNVWPTANKHMFMAGSR